MNRLPTLCLLAFAVPLSAGSFGSRPEPPPVATFSIVAIDPANGDLALRGGIAVVVPPA